MAKGNIRSFRYSDEVAGILARFKGSSLNDKFENLVLYCFSELPRVERELAALRSCYSDLDKQCKEKQKMLCDLNALLDVKRGLIASLSRLESDVEKFTRRVDEHVTQSCPVAELRCANECVTKEQRKPKNDCADIYDAFVGAGDVVLEALFPSGE